MVKKAAAKKAAGSAGQEADPRFEPVVKAFAKIAGVSLMESKSKATRGLRYDGKSFGMSSHGRLILKLTEDRAAELIADGTGTPFEASAGRPMKGWIEVTHPKADWVALTKEAYRVAAALPSSRKAAAGTAKAKRKF